MIVYLTLLAIISSTKPGSTKVGIGMDRDPSTGLPKDTDGIIFRMLGSWDDPHHKLHNVGWSGSLLTRSKPLTNTEPNK
jgi:hypothetical protein